MPFRKGSTVFYTKLFKIFYTGNMNDEVYEKKCIIVVLSKKSRFFLMFSVAVLRHCIGQS